MSHKAVYMRGLAAALFLASWPVTAQTIVATARGRVTDPSGAVVPAATVTVLENSTNLTRSAVTDSMGQYLIANLPAGSYDITVDHPGFEQGKQLKLVLHVGEEATI